MPVDGGIFRQPVPDVDPDRVALADMEAGTGDLTVVGVSVDGHPGQDRPADHGRLEIEHLDVAFHAEGRILIAPDVWPEGR